jgi:hypothetical protein
MNHGVIFWNVGTGCCTRLLVALHSLRKHYAGPATVISEGEESGKLLRGMPYADLLETQFDVPEGAQRAFLCKTLLHTKTPYEVNIFLDSDVLVRGDITPLFGMAEQSEFVATQFANWRSGKGLLRKRINAWRHLYPGAVNRALATPDYPALNESVFAFRNDAGFLREWYNYTLPGRAIHLPEETSMQVWLPQWPHAVADQAYNCSCKYSRPHDADTRICHFHGRKHRRPNNPFGGDLWEAEYREVLAENPIDFREWSHLTDSKLLKHPYES